MDEDGYVDIHPHVINWTMEGISPIYACMDMHYSWYIYMSYRNVSCLSVNNN